MNRTRRAPRMRNSANNRADDGRALKQVVAVGPDRHEPADVVIDPFFSIHDPDTLEPDLPGRAIADRTVKIQQPIPRAGAEAAADGAAERIRRRRGNLDRAVAEQQA